MFKSYRKKLTVLVLHLFFIFFPTLSAYSWSSPAHRIIAAIAYRHLNSAAKVKIDQLTKNMFYSHSGWVRFLLAATWPDQIKFNDITAFNAWHFIDSPYSIDAVPTQSVSKQNVAWALQQSFKVLASPKPNSEEKAWFLNFMVHFVGDAHQPLHCISRYSKTYPHGDQGGNLFPIQSSIATDLHGFWDRGAGLFPLRRRVSFHKIKKWANQIENEYPESYFGKKARELDPWSWVQESYQLAIQYAYANIQPNGIPNQTYVKIAQETIKKRLALAGYRLANSLNMAFSQGGRG